MAHLRNNTTTPFHVPRPTTAANMDENETNRTQVEPSTKSRQVRWNDDMDGLMIVALVNEVLAGHKRSDNGFTAFQILKAIESMQNGCGILVSDKNVRARLKTLKREYAEGKPDFGKWMTKLCRRYDDMECIFGNDTATGDRAVSGFDTFSPMLVDESVNEHDTPTEETDPSPIPTRKRHAAEGTTSDDYRKTRGMDLQLVDIMKVMKAFRSDGDLAKVFMSLTNTTIMRALVYEQLGRDPPPLP
ncbi:Myb DNA-bind 3 domain-containing protein [Abeliophyllum distichum]|uniref:Myb DNA-bind 3 domain-containing protein n=1 Tax=Abeliophyllum distichum TaxID=126358 RepID=A0ABD1Q2Y2_9LAMI